MYIIFSEYLSFIFLFKAIIGKGPSENDLKKLYKDREQVFFAGEMSGDSLSQAYASADVFVMPSDSETLGFVVLEAMASGVPVVGVASGGVKTLIENGENGYLTSFEDGYTEFSQKVKALLNNPEDRKAMGLRARKYAENFGWEAATSRLRNIQYPLAIELNKSSRDSTLRHNPHLVDIENAIMANSNLHV